MEQQKRKPNRLSEYDYSESGYYFVTICAANKQKIFGTIVGANCVRPNAGTAPVGANCVCPQIKLSNIGLIVQSNIEVLDNTYPSVSVDRYVIMPNHLHLIIKISGRPQVAPTVSRAIKQFKGSVTKQVGIPIWQRSFYDHIIRDERDYLRIAEYMENNPARWDDDPYFV